MMLTMVFLVNPSGWGELGKLGPHALKIYINCFKDGSEWVGKAVLGNEWVGWWARQSLGMETCPSELAKQV